MKRYVILPEIAEAVKSLNIIREPLLKIVTQGSFKYPVDEETVVAAMIELKSHLSDLKQFLAFSKEAKTRYNNISIVYDMLKELL